MGVSIIKRPGSLRNTETPILLVALLLISCRTKRMEVPEEPLAKPSLAGLALLSEEDVSAPRMVHAIKLDDIDFRVSGVRVGEQVFLQYKTPVLTYEMPAIADYVEILRCPSDRIIMGGADILEDVERKAMTAEEETRIFRANNFWEMAVQTSGCILVASSYSDPFLADSFAETGTYFYYLRACINPKRLIGFETFTTTNCSRQVTRSVEYKHVNERDRLELLALQKASRLRQRMHGLSRQIVAGTQIFGQTLLDCQNRKGKQVVDNEQKEALRDIITFAGGIGGGAAIGTAVGAMRARPGGRIVGGLSGMAIGAVGGLFASYLANAIDRAFIRKPEVVVPRDEERCYSVKEETLAADALEEYKGEKKHASNVCSCSHAITMQTRIQNQKKELDQLMGMEKDIFGKYEGPQESEPGTGTEPETTKESP
ncbi:MAG: hypothetical protein HYW48_09125 [Deltaproteobacteria bacterium]|nr:hypothetical protein [Deltaproteobacteria bacterium]